MEQSEFLEKNVFTGLTNINDGFDSENIYYFSEADFEIVLQRAEHFGLSIYGIEPWLNGEMFDVLSHDSFRKKATDPKWYNKAFSEFKKRQEGLAYAASYKVSKKLLERE
ncbi:hypothetical protein HNV10_09600 [Winogradskyella litoriviva]|uniref:Uncharacterized protein n=1 Tax=Winogradskyella litoriviva TaxID=1220182 RepID=A0ABX2E525_9FLAO|nr:hypothetical protein [Winogradskyella litoriviva]NRD23493.1 hypothetical protein [Winogradskyella litoriviva]